MPNCEIYFPISSETNMQIWNHFHSMVLGSVGRGCFKGNVQFLLLCKPPKSCTPQVCITFLQVTQKILTKDIFHWLELITEILSFLQTFSVRKTTTRFFKYSQKSARKSTKKAIFKAYFGPLNTKLQIILAATYIPLFLPDTNNCFFMCNTMYPYLFLLFSHFVFIFTFSLLNFSPQNTFCKSQVSYNFIANWP